MSVNSLMSITQFTSPIVSESMMAVKIIGLMQAFCSLLIIVGLIVGIIYMIKRKN